MTHMPHRTAPRTSRLRNLLLLGVATGLASACASKPPSTPLKDAQGRLQGQGFIVTPPQGQGWKVAENAYDSVVYVKSSDPEAGQLADGLDNVDQPQKSKVSVHASLGVVTLPANSTASAEDAESFAKAAQSFLSNRFVGQPRISLMDLKTTPYSLNGALCAKFEALQVERYNSRRYSAGRLEFVNRGFLCRHPNNRTLVVHGFFNETHYRLAPKPEDTGTAKEATRFLESVVFAPL